MQQEEEIVTLPGIRERMALFKKAGKKIGEEINKSKEQEQRRVGKLDPKKADIKSFVTSLASSGESNKPKFQVLALGDSMQLGDMHVSESDLAEASNMIKSSGKMRYGGSNSGSLSSPPPAVTAAGRSSKERGAVTRPRFERTYSIEGMETMQKPQQVKDKEEAVAKEDINAVLQKEMGDGKIASSFQSIRVRYLTAMGTLRPDYYDSSDSIRNLADPAAVRKRLAEKRKIEAERKRRYDKLKSAWEDYEEVAQDKPTELTEEDAQIERDLDEIEADIAQEWQDFTEDVIRVAGEQAEADADAAADKSDDGEDNDNKSDDNGVGEDSDVQRWREEARRLKADAAARRKRREAHVRHRQARKLKAKNDHEGAREILAQAAVNMKEARTLRDEARKEVITIDVDALEIDDDLDKDLLGESQLSFTEASNLDEEAVDAAVEREINDAVAAQVIDGADDEKKEDQSLDVSNAQDGDDDDDDDDDDMASGNKSKPKKHAGGANRGMRPGVLRGRSFDNDDDPREPKEGNDSEDDEEKESSEAEKVSQKKKLKKKSKSKKDIDNNDEQQEESSNEEHISGHKKKHKKKQKAKLDVEGDKDDDDGEMSAEEHNYRSKQNGKGEDVYGCGSEDEEEEEEEKSSDGDKKTSKKKRSYKPKASLEKGIDQGSKSAIRMKRRASLASTSSCSSDEDNAPIRRRQSRRASVCGSLQSNPGDAAELVPGKKKKAGVDKEDPKKNKGSKGKHQDSDNESHGSDSKASVASKSKSKASALNKKEEPVAFDTFPSKNLDGSDWINPFKAWTNKPKKTKMEGARISIKVPEKTDNWRKTRHNFIMDNAPFYWHKVSGSFQVMVKVTGDLGTMYDKAGLMIRLDEENWIMTGMEYYNNQMNHSTCVTHDFTDWSLSPLPASAAKDGAWFCLKRIGNSYEAFYSLDGNNWIQTRQGLFNDAQSIQVGIFSACPMGESYKVSFDMYRCKNLIE